MISAKLRDLLIEHIDGPVPLLVRSTRAGQPHRALRVRAAVSLGLLSYGSNPHKGRPKETFITEKGREALAKALADWADALSRTGRLDLLRKVAHEAAAGRADPDEPEGSPGESSVPERALQRPRVKV